MLHTLNSTTHLASHCELSRAHCVSARHALLVSKLCGCLRDKVKTVGSTDSHAKQTDSKLLIAPGCETRLVATHCAATEWFRSAKGESASEFNTLKHTHKQIILISLATAHDRSVDRQTPHPAREWPLRRASWPAATTAHQTLDCQRPRCYQRHC